MGHHERHRTRDIERYTGQPLRIETIVGLEPRRRPTTGKPSFGGPSGPRGGDPRRSRPSGAPGARPAHAGHGAYAPHGAAGAGPRSERYQPGNSAPRSRAR